ncbi:MAG: hypothetical protein WAN14_15720 [Candidatus Acidiferrales bacterium]
MPILTTDQCERRVKQLAGTKSTSNFEIPEADYLETIKFLREELNIVTLQRDAKRFTDGRD